MKERERRQGERERRRGRGDRERGREGERDRERDRQRERGTGGESKTLTCLHIQTGNIPPRHCLEFRRCHPTDLSVSSKRTVAAEWKTMETLSASRVWSSALMPRSGSMRSPAINFTFSATSGCFSRTRSNSFGHKIRQTGSVLRSFFKMKLTSSNGNRLFYLRFFKIRIVFYYPNTIKQI